MAEATTTGTAAAAHIEGVDFAGKTGTAQVVDGGDTHVKGGEKTPNSWFVGMVPRRNPEIVIAVLQEHGDWGSTLRTSPSNGRRIREQEAQADHNLLDQAGSGKPFEMGAVWSDPATPGRNRSGAPWQDSVLHAGHFMIHPVPCLDREPSPLVGFPCRSGCSPCHCASRKAIPDAPLSQLPRL